MLKFIDLKSLALLSVLLVYSMNDAMGQLSEQSQFNEARSLYEHGAFQAARLKFNQIQSETFYADAQYFVAACAIKSSHGDGESLMQRFIAQYPHHVYAQKAYLEMANHYFSLARYEEALRNYKKSGSELLPTDRFRKGYSEFKVESYDAALVTFQLLEGSFFSEEKDAAYFQGFIYHAKEDIENAQKYFQIALESETYRVAALELYCSILYDLQKYEILIELVETNLSPVTNGIILNFIADSKYALQSFDPAAKDYTTLLSKFSKQRNERTYFKAGYSHYLIGDMDKAEHYLKRSAVTDDTVGAYASYYLGVIYNEQENYPFAVSSFENTAKYETDLKEYAMYYQAVALLRQSKFEAVIEVLSVYSERYGVGRFSQQANEMVSTAFAQTDNYSLAIKYIEGLDKLTPSLKETYQRVSYLRGIALFNKKKIAPAIEVFQKALIHDVDAQATQQTYYWIAEALSIQGKYDEAIFYYNSVSPNENPETYLKAKYGLGYAHYNLADYSSALDQFEAFESKADASIKSKYLKDVLLRAGDCNFAMKAYESGIEYYQKALDGGSKEVGYLYFQIGLLNRYLDKDKEAKSYFQQLIDDVPNSPSIDHAQFQIGQIEFENGENEAAARTNLKLVEKHPQSKFVPFALLNMAVSLENMGDSPKSIERYKEILHRFPRHQVANSALLGLQDKSSSGQLEDFEKYLALYKEANPNSGALENIDFETAKNYFYDQNYEKAIKKFDAFRQSYEVSPLVMDVIYFIGDSYYRLGRFEESLIEFQSLSAEVDYAKHAKVIYRMATMELSLKNYSSSIALFHQLRQASNSARNRINYQNGLMECFYATESYDSASLYANHLLDNPRTDVLMGAKASLILGRSAYEQLNYELALENFLPLISNAPDENGAQAYYYVSKIYADQKQFDKALESLFVMTNNFKSYELWIGKSFLLMADIYLETDEVFQAKATLNSLLDHSEIEEVKVKATQKLAEIESLDTKGE